MNFYDFLQIALFVLALIIFTPPLGAFMARVLQGQRTFLHPVLGPVEQLTYRLIGVDPEKEMTWVGYTVAVMAFNILGFLVLFAILLGQGMLPLNPQSLPGLQFPLAFNTAMSFMTNTNWQAYSGEAALSYFSQMIGLNFQNFVSAATGFAAFIAVVRGFTRRSVHTLGNFWADLVRTTLYILVPLSIILAIILVSQGVVQNFSGYITAKTLEGTEQVIPQGPAASQIAIKQLGTNGGGFFGVNSTHPFENPTPLSNFVEMFAILLLPAALTYTFGMLVGDRRQGWVLFIAMMVLFAGGFALSYWAEGQTNPVTQLTQNMEGKEQRLGVINSVIWSTATTSASNGSVNAMHDSLSPLAGGVAIFNMMLGEIIFGGVGCGLYGMLMYVLLTVFIAGLMVGRTPEYLGKKIEAYEMRLAILVLLVPSAFILAGAAVACLYPTALASLANKGPHGFGEILYAFSSAAGNNGSAFAGLAADTPFYNYALGLCMFIGRFVCLIPVLAIAGSVAAKKTVPFSSGTFPTTGVAFVLLLLGTILIVGALTHLPALALGPLAEHMLMLQGRTF